MISSVSSLYPLTCQSSHPREPQKSPSDLLLSLCPPQPQATCLSHLLSALPRPCPLPQSWGRPNCTSDHICQNTISKAPVSPQP